MLELRSLKLLRGRFAIDADVSITAPITAFLGPSGSGKSSLLDAIAGFVEPVSGDVRYNSSSLLGLPPSARPVSILFQDNNLFPHLSVAQNLSIALPRGTSRRDANAAVYKALERVALDGYGARKPAELSGGQQSRVALARVLLQARPIVLLDEPFSALGPGLKAQMLSLVKDVAEEQSLQVIMVSHDPADARQICHETCIISQDGSLEPPRPTAAVLDAPSDELRAYLGLDAQQ